MKHLCQCSINASQLVYSNLVKQTDNQENRSEITAFFRFVVLGAQPVLFSGLRIVFYVRYRCCKRPSVRWCSCVSDEFRHTFCWSAYRSSHPSSITPGLPACVGPYHIYVSNAITAYYRTLLSTEIFQTALWFSRIADFEWVKRCMCVHNWHSTCEKQVRSLLLVIFWTRKYESRKPPGHTFLDFLKNQTAKDFNMRIFRTLMNAASVSKQIDFYSRFSPSPLSMKQFIDFGKSGI